jgi:glycosyltransferase involved in cell wall biosynthesis
MIAPTPFFSDRGAHVQIYEEIVFLQGRGHRILLQTYGLGKNVTNVATSRIINFPWYRKISSGPSFTKILYIPLMIALGFFNTIKFRPDVIHAHLPDGALIAKFLKIFFKRVAYIYDLQGSLSEESIQHKFIKRGSVIHRLFLKLELKMIYWFPVITQSDSILDFYKNLADKNLRISNVKDGVDTSIFFPDTKDEKLLMQLGIQSTAQIVLYVGALEEYQGIDLLLEAFAKVPQVPQRTILVVIGYPNVSKYQKVALAHGISHNVQFLGLVDYFELRKYLNLADIAIAPKISTTEGDGKIYNYLACGIPTISFDRPVSREIGGSTMLYSKLKDTDELAKNISILLADSELRRKLSHASRKRAVEHLSWDKVALRIEKIYEEAIAKNDNG